MISLSESGGGNLAGDGDPDPWGVHGFLDGGRVYGQQAQLSAAGIPQITVSHGNATAGGAYQVALSDYVILVRGQTQLFLAGPPLLKAATGEVADHETLGGAEMHATVSQTGEYLAESDEDGIRIARMVVSQLPPDAGRALSPDQDAPCPVTQRVNCAALFLKINGFPTTCGKSSCGLLMTRGLMNFSPWLINRRFVAMSTSVGGEWELLPIMGRSLPQGAKKASQFLQLCDQSNTPMLFLHNTTGFLVGVEAEQAGQVKHGSKMIQAVANFRPPKISIIVGNSYGAGNYAMCSKSLMPAFVFSWPTARQAVMGGSQAASVLRIVAEDRAALTGQPLSDEQEATLQFNPIESLNPWNMIPRRCFVLALNG